MPETRELLQPGSLWERLRSQTSLAQETGALKPIPTEFRVVGDGGVDFQVRVAPSLEEKIRENREQRAREAAGQDADPFRPPEPDLFVGYLTPTHFGLLNKFPVLRHHLLLVTDDFEDQLAPLNPGDFEALYLALTELDGLGFYNAGRIAGASQPHKHLQLVPLPLDGTDRHLPIETLLHPEQLSDRPGHSPDLPFPHAACRLDFAADGPGGLFERFRWLTREMGLEAEGATYNLLVTREWMLLVPRTRERFEGVMINALGFAGGFLVRNEQDVALLREVGPMRVLQGVSGALEGTN